MKLIIDIPDEEYETLSKTSEKEKVNELSYYERVIANGIPYEPKGDLISREALKKEIAKFHQEEKERLHNSLWESIGLNALYRLIDNAPTVEPCYQTTSCLDCKNYDKETHNCPRYCEVIKEAIKSRPRGEWKLISVGLTNKYQCSLCGRTISPMYSPMLLSDYPFCHCGAEMKGGAE